MKRSRTSSDHSPNPKRPRAKFPSLPSPATSDDLSTLLDLSALSDVDALLGRFDAIAAALLHEYDIVVRSESGKETILEPMEVEFYFWSELHRDAFTHGSEEQRIAGNWYFHRTPRRSKDGDDSHVIVGSTGYRGGTRKGLDLTLGKNSSPVTSSYFLTVKETESTSVAPRTSTSRGGILLRTVRDQSTEEVTSGPSLLVDHILALSGATSISSLVTERWDGNIGALNIPECFDAGRAYMYLAPSKEKRLSTIYTSPRIGLELSNPNVACTLACPRVHFVGKHYRYFVHPELLVANGRAQTMLGVQRSLSNHLTVDALCTATGMKLKTVLGYLEAYEKGKVGEVTLDMFVGAKGKGVCSSAARYLQMMGCISRMEEQELSP
ncbi:hypothetical protein CPB85DRAFT_1227650 [Mucidula mucida]|nr:hypothetical protein CPB85DRAFT_1227650 [Mucidula mucida]